VLYGRVLDRPSQLRVVAARDKKYDSNRSASDSRAVLLRWRSVQPFPIRTFGLTPFTPFKKGCTTSVRKRDNFGRHHGKA
jgi:hypothetical protein